MFDDHIIGVFVPLEAPSVSEFAISHVSFPIMPQMPYEIDWIPLENQPHTARCCISAAKSWREPWFVANETSLVAYLYMIKSDWPYRDYMLSLPNRRRYSYRVPSAERQVVNQGRCPQVLCWNSEQEPRRGFWEKEVVNAGRMLDN